MLLRQQVSTKTERHLPNSEIHHPGKKQTTKAGYIRHLKKPGVVVLAQSVQSFLSHLQRAPHPHRLARREVTVVYHNQVRLQKCKTATPHDRTGHDTTDKTDNWHPPHGHMRTGHHSDAPEPNPDQQTAVVSWLRLSTLQVKSTLGRGERGGEGSPPAPSLHWIPTVTNSRTTNQKASNYSSSPPFYCATRSIRLSASQ